MENQFKLDAIKLAWIRLIGEDNFGRLRYDDNGYSDWHCRKLMPKEYWSQLYSKVKPGAKSKVSGGDLLYRPKSLNGIETNNGWNRIITNDDLPKSFGEYIFLYDGRIVTIHYEEGDRFSKLHTHWREPIEIKRPVF